MKKKDSQNYLGNCSMLDGHKFYGVYNIISLVSYG